MEPRPKSNKDSILLRLPSRPRCRILGPITCGQETPEGNDVPVQRSYRGGNGGGVVCLVRWCIQKAKVVIVLAMER